MVRFDSCGKLGCWIGSMQILQSIYRLDGNLARTSDGWIICCIRGFLVWIIDGYLASRVAGFVVGKFGAIGDFIRLRPQMATSSRCN